jgi:hypothetical protein
MELVLGHATPGGTFIHVQQQKIRRGPLDRSPAGCAARESRERSRERQKPANAASIEPPRLPVSHPGGGVSREPFPDVFPKRGRAGRPPRIPHRPAFSADPGPAVQAAPPTPPGQARPFSSVGPHSEFSLPLFPAASRIAPTVRPLAWRSASPRGRQIRLDPRRGSSACAHSLFRISFS